jgi:uncharacterized protein (DUF2267 family)
MSLASFAPIKTTLHTTDLWLGDLMGDLGWEDRCLAYRALQVVLHALRDRLPVKAVAALGSQLPLLVRGMYYEGWSPSETPVPESEKEEFLSQIAAAFRNNPEIDPERVARAVLKVLKRYAPSGEYRNEGLIIPPGIRVLWLVIE